ncbi:MAG: hypothetical protein LBH43_17205 [Treponema sp.]|jgi:hypothetical protein|nr:hypothetical protein [Treponema sp.]
MVKKKETEVTNQQFFKLWKKVCKENEERLLWLSDCTAEYTNIILKNDNYIIEKIADELGLEVNPEYYQIDAVLCDQSDYVRCKPEHKTWGKEWEIGLTV